MKQKKLRQALAIVALVFMGIFTVTFVITLVDPTMYNGVFGYISLVSVLLGVGLYLVIKFLLKEKEAPEYLPKEDPTANPDETQADTVVDETTANDQSTPMEADEAKAGGDESQADGESKEDTANDA